MLRNTKLNETKPFCCVEMTSFLAIVESLALKLYYQQFHFQMLESFGFIGCYLLVSSGFDMKLPVLEF